MTATTLTINNATAVPMQEVPALPVNDFRDTLLELVQQQEHRVSAFFGLPASPAGLGLELVAVLNHPEDGNCKLVRTVVKDSFLSLTPECPAFHWFERELAEQYYLEIPGHPWLKPIRFQPPLPGSGGSKTTTTIPNLTVGDTDYFTLEGEACHEVAVGPVHAGVIEPGHFRFQCLGEDVY